MVKKSVSYKISTKLMDITVIIFCLIIITWPIWLLFFGIKSLIGLF